MEQVNDEIYKYAEENKIICGTTASILLISDETFASINVGDSSIYYADRRRAIHVSTEHSYDVMSIKVEIGQYLMQDAVEDLFRQ